MTDHVHLLVSIPPKPAVPGVVGYLTERILRYIQKQETEDKRLDPLEFPNSSKAQS